MYLSLTDITDDLGRPKIRTAQNVSLSSFFPAGTRFFYGYPAGEDSGFLNRAVPATEELVAARTFCCAGQDVFTVVFGANVPPSIDQDLLYKLSIPQLKPVQTIVLPKSISILLTGKPRNDAIKSALKDSIRPGSLIMAQPYTDPELSNLYQLDPAITIWLNDKNNMPKYINSEMMPDRFGSFVNGCEFASVAKKLILPIVVKITSSSSGDGVYICLNDQDLNKAVVELQDIDGTILVEKYIEAVYNYGVQFGVPFSSLKTPTLLGINGQITSRQGEFLGGTIDSTEIPSQLQPAVQHLLEDILPFVRQKGWYGVGSFDVLIDSAGKQFFIDCNFRMTGMSAYHFLVANDEIATPLISFSGEFKGTQAEFEEHILPFVDPSGPEHCIRLINLTYHDNIWRCNGALLFSSNNEALASARKLLDSGLQSDALQNLV